jgi:hypothetical protein
MGHGHRAVRVTCLARHTRASKATPGGVLKPATWCPAPQVVPAVCRHVAAVTHQPTALHRLRRSARLLGPFHCGTALLVCLKFALRKAHIPILRDGVVLCSGVARALITAIAHHCHHSARLADLQISVNGHRRRPGERAQPGAAPGRPAARLLEPGRLRALRRELDGVCKTPRGALIARCCVNHHLHPS